MGDYPISTGHVESGDAIGKDRAKGRSQTVAAFVAESPGNAGDGIGGALPDSRCLRLDRQVTDEHFEQAAMDGGSAAQKAAQSVPELDRMAPQAKEKPSFCEGLRGDAIPNESLMGAVGFEPT